MCHCMVIYYEYVANVFSFFHFPPKDFNLVILGPLKSQPSPFPPVAELDEKTGTLSIVKSDVTCQSKGGTVGSEVVACWYFIKDVFGKEVPITKEFEGVKRLHVAASNPKDYNFDCILSANNVSLESCYFLTCYFSIQQLSLLIHMPTIDWGIG